MPTLTELDGFEHQVKSTNATATLNPALWGVVADTGNRITFVTGRNGIGTAARFDLDGTNAARMNRNLTTAGTLVVASFYVRWIRTPTSVTTRMFLASSDLVGIIGLNTSGQVLASFGSGTGIVTSTGPTINDGAWHRIDARW